MRKFLSLITAAATMAVISQSALAAGTAGGRGFWGSIGDAFSFFMTHCDWM